MAASKASVKIVEKVKRVECFFKYEDFLAGWKEGMFGDGPSVFEAFEYCLKRVKPRRGIVYLEGDCFQGKVEQVDYFDDDLQPGDEIRYALEKKVLKFNKEREIKTLAGWRDVGLSQDLEANGLTLAFESPNNCYNRTEEPGLLKQANAALAKVQGKDYFLQSWSGHQGATGFRIWVDERKE